MLMHVVVYHVVVTMLDNHLFVHHPNLSTILVIDDEATVKRLSIDEEHIELRPENKSLKPIIVDQQDELKIIGKVLHVCSGANTDASGVTM